MKLTPNTRVILQNFSKINNIILIEQGNEIKIKRSSGDLIAIYECEETFDGEVAIHDLPTFLSLLSTVNNPELEITEDTIVILGDNDDSIVYWQASKAIVQKAAVSKKIDPGAKYKTIAKLKLTSEQIKKILDSARILKHENLQMNFSPAGEHVRFMVADPRNPTSNMYRQVFELIEGDAHEDGRRFSYKIELFMMISGDYEILVYENGLIEARNADKTNPLVYYIGPNKE